MTGEKLLRGYYHHDSRFRVVEVFCGRRFQESIRSQPLLQRKYFHGHHIPECALSGFCGLWVFFCLFRRHCGGLLGSVVQKKPNSCAHHPNSHENNRDDRPGGQSVLSGGSWGRGGGLRLARSENERVNHGKRHPTDGQGLRRQEGGLCRRRRPAA